jgi:hypothetical protein
MIVSYSIKIYGWKLRLGRPFAWSLFLRHNYLETPWTFHILLRNQVFTRFSENEK